MSEEQEKDVAVAEQLKGMKSFAPEVTDNERIFLVPIEDIVIKPRQRKTYDADHINRLARSIERAGLLHPITLEDESNELVAGFCRLQAHMKLGRDLIQARRRSSIDDKEKKVLELEENVQRLGLEWWEKASAIAEIHKLQQELNPEGWSQAQTAEMVGESVGTINQSVQLSKELEVNPTIRDHSTLVGALKDVKNKKQFAERKKQLERKKEGKIRTFPAEILQGDALELIKQEKPKTYDAIFTNFPFGVDFKLGKEQRALYKDGEDMIVKLVRAVTHEAYRVLKPDSWMVALFDVRKITYSNKQKDLAKVLLSLHPKAISVAFGLEYDQWATSIAESLGLTYWMEEAGFDFVQVMPHIWVKPNKTQGYIGDPKKGFIVAYEAMVIAGKGVPFIVKQGRNNVWIYDTLNPSERDFELQMPPDFCRDLVGTFCLGGSNILDPFAGVGSFGEAALDNQCSFRGFELDPDRAEKGNTRLQEHVLAAEAKS